jgi:hypothetical protein
MHRNIILKQSSPFVEAAAGCGARILRVEREEYNFVALGGAELFNRLGGKGMPVAHGHETTCIHTIGSEFVAQRASLLFGEAPDGRSSPDRLVVMLYFLGSSGGNQPGERLAADPGEWEIDDIWIAEQVKKKRLDRSWRVGAAKLEQYYTYSPCWVSHPPGVLEEGGCYSKSVRRVNVEFAAEARFS